MIWTLIRTTGFVAYAFLSAAAIFGLLVAAKLLGRSASTKSLTYTHESLSVAAIISTVAHVVFLYMDEYIEFTVIELLVPGRSDWKPIPVNMGILAFYGLILITVSFYVRKRIGQSAWRLLHFASFGVFVAAAAHGITAGTDTSTVVGIIVYTATISLVVGLTMARVIIVRGGKQRAGARGRQAGSAPNRPTRRPASAESPAPAASAPAAPTPTTAPAHDTGHTPVAAPTEGGGRVVPLERGAQRRAADPFANQPAPASAESATPASGSLGPGTTPPPNEDVVVWRDVSRETRAE